MRRAPCVVSVADHTGWAHLVCVSAAVGGVPSIIERRRVALIERGLPTQPYEHESSAMRDDEADALVQRVRRSIVTHTSGALDRLVAELATNCTVVAVAIRQPPFPGLPASVATVRTSNRLLYAADGMMYHLAICRAARLLDLDVQFCRRGDEASRAAQLLGVTDGDVEAFVSGAGRPAGPPWTQEHRRAYAAGIAALVPYARERLTLSATAVTRRPSKRR